jgi:hypothetical protein
MLDLGWAEVAVIMLVARRDRPQGICPRACTIGQWTGNARTKRRVSSACWTTWRARRSSIRRLARRAEKIEGVPRVLDASTF